MKANVLRQFGGPEMLIWEAVPTPVPQAGEVLVRVEAAGVNLGDTMMRRGTGMPLTPPVVLGHEAAGVVEALGEGVDHLAVGQRVLAAAYIAGKSGAYASHVCLPSAAVYPLPPGVSFAAANALATAGVTALGLVDLRPVAGRKVVVHAAAGGVGNILVQLLAMAGADVIATVGDPAKGEHLAGLGATHILSTRQDWAASARELTGGRGPDLIYDSIGGAVTEQSLDILAPQGTLVVYGGSSGTIAAIDPGRMMSMVMRSQGLLGFSLMPTLSAPDGSQLIGAMLADLLARVENGSLKPLIGHRLPLHQAAEAHRLIESRASVGKIVLVPET